MENLIEQLMAIEAKAQSITKAEKAHMKELEAEIEHDKQAMQNDLQMRAKKKKEELLLRAERTADEQITALTREHEEALDKLRRQFRENQEKWADQIFTEITTK